jgi:phosphopantothenoylcysteine decarboxylase / phosphopantothenate---cysteine ligase
MKILVTAGPTREAIDPVRFISNRSSGKMGYAIARVGASRGHDVRLISGPAHLPPPGKVQLINIVTAEEMLGAVKENVGWCDALVMVAAVADWRPKKASAGKIKKNEPVLGIELERTADILSAIHSLKGKRLFVGFAAETGNLIEEARRKLVAKSLDLIVANDVSRTDAGFESDNNKVTLISAGGEIEDLPMMSKDAVAGRILDWIESKTCYPPPAIQS